MPKRTGSGSDWGREDGRCETSRTDRSRWSGAPGRLREPGA